MPGPVRQVKRFINAYQEPAPGFCLIIIVLCHSLQVQGSPFTVQGCLWTVNLWTLNPWTVTEKFMHLVGGFVVKIILPFRKTGRKFGIPVPKIVGNDGFCMFEDWFVLNQLNLAAFGRTSLTGWTWFTWFTFILIILLILSKKWKFLYYELSALRADFLDRINWIYMISLLFFILIIPGPDLANRLNRMIRTRGTL